MSDRENILNKLRQAQQPFTDIPPVENRKHVVPMADTSASALRERFVQEAEKLNCVIHAVGNEEDAIEQVLTLIGDDKTIQSWNPTLILPDLQDSLKNANIQISSSRTEPIRCGVTGIDAGLAATGSIIVNSGEGKPRHASLLPDVHIAVMNGEQILPDLEVYFETQKPDNFAEYRQVSNISIISGPSRTADIGMELVMGAHGPKQVHIVLIG